jgi:hypothetical protein
MAINFYHVKEEPEKKIKNNKTKGGKERIPFSNTVFYNANKKDTVGKKKDYPFSLIVPSIITGLTERCNGLILQGKRHNRGAYESLSINTNLHSVGGPI